MIESNNLCEAVVRSLSKHKGVDIRALRVGDLTVLTDYFVMVTGTSSTHVRSLADYLEEEVAAAGGVLRRTEGYDRSDWILLDFGGVVVHIFQAREREYYGLEHLWNDGEQVDISAWELED